MPSSSGVRSYSLVGSPSTGLTGTGFDQIVDAIHRDAGLAGATDGKDIKAGARAANQLNELIVKAAMATHAADDKVFTVDEVRAMNAYLRSNYASEWTVLHGDDEADAETGYHLVQNDGGNSRYRGNNLLDTVVDGIYHLGFEIRDGHLLNEDGDPNASLEQVAEWLTQFYVDHSQSGTGLDRMTDLIMADAGLDRRISDQQIAAGADAANGLNLMLREALAAAGVARDNWISVSDVVALNSYLRADAGRLAEWTRLHGDDEKRLETGFHKVQNDGASTTFFGENLVNTVADGIYHLGFMIKDGHLLNEDGDRNAALSDVADWLNYFLSDASSTGTGLDRIVDVVKSDRGLARNTAAAEINEGAKAADAMNRIIVDLIGKTGASADGWITVEELTAMNHLIQGNTALLKQWTNLHGDDEGGNASGYHYVQNNGATTDFFGRNLVDTVGDGIYHLGFEIRDGHFLNEDGDPNASLFDVATWLNFFYGQAPVVLGDEGANRISGDERSEQINAGGCDDNVTAGAGNDLVYGGWGNDRIAGDDGNDLIYGGSGNDSLAGGAGDDTFRVSGHLGCGFESYDRYDGGSGKDRIVAYGGKVDIGMAAFGPGNSVEIVDVSAVTGAARIVGDWQNNRLDFSATTFVGKLSIDGGGGQDSIIGSAGDDSIDGGSWGDQTLSGGNGNDVLHGGTGTDQLAGGAGDDTFRVSGHLGSGFEGYDRYDGGSGKDRIVAYGGKVDIGMTAFGPGNSVEIVDVSAVTGAARIVGDWQNNRLDFSTTTFVGKLTIDGGGGQDSIIGSAGDDSIDGGSWGDQTLSGGNGNDVLHGGTGTDQLAGGVGDDTFRVSGHLGSGFEGYDRYDGGSGKDRIVAYGGKVDIGMTAFGPGNSVEIVDVSAVTGAARIVGDWQNNRLDFSTTTFVGKLAIDGGGGQDSIIGSAGDDSIDGGSWGDQTLSGGNGNDVLHGGTGTDQLAGGAGDDTFRVSGHLGSGFEGYDRYDGGSGKDRIVAYGGKVDIGMAAFGPGNSVEIVDVSAVTGAARIVGDWQNNRLDFSATTFVGKLTIDSGDGQDVVIGSSGGDVLFGGTGADILDGRGGNDKLAGGSGADTFVFGVAWGHDVVSDFRDGTDRLNFHDTGVAGLQDLSLAAVGSNALIAWHGNEVLLIGVRVADLGPADFIF
jgi:Ca2+-binding RTX toxin-like protein